MLEKLNRVNYLFDIYGVLLTAKQQSVMEMYYKEDFSLAEVAEQLDISRQAVYDLLSRAVGALEHWEKKLNLYETYLERKKEGLKALELLSQKELKDHEIDWLRKLVQKYMIES